MRELGGGQDATLLHEALRDRCALAPVAARTVANSRARRGVLAARLPGSHGDAPKPNASADATHCTTNPLSNPASQTRAIRARADAPTAAKVQAPAVAAPIAQRAPAKNDLYRANRCPDRY